MISRAHTGLISHWWWTIDKWLVASNLLLLIIGIMLSFAASPSVALHIGRLDSYIFVKQHIIFALCSFVILLLVSFFTPRYLKISYVALSLISLILLVLVLFFGHEIKGSVRWIKLFCFTIQPSEFLKPSFIITTAWLYGQRNFANKKLCYAISCCFYMLSLILLLKEPDVGQSALLTIIWCLMLYLADISLTLIALIGSAFSGLFYLMYLYSYHVHQRIEKFLGGMGDNFQVNMGQEAILHGGWFGVGPGEGTIKRIIPDSHTDFVFSVAAEEYGLVFCILITLLLAFIVLRVMTKALQETDNFSRLAIMGLAAQFGIQSFINIAVNLHLLPAKGMTLPFISYGGSSMLSIALCSGALICLTRKKTSLKLKQI